VIHHVSLGAVLWIIVGARREGFGMTEFSCEWFKSFWEVSKDGSEPRTAIRSPLGFDLAKEGGR
jgi:hypothetical protein